MNLDHTAEKLNQHKTVELRKLAKQYDIKETGGRPVNSGRKADLIASILRSIETLRQSDEAAKRFTAKRLEEQRADEAWKAGVRRAADEAARKVAADDERVAEIKKTIASTAKDAPKGRKSAVRKTTKPKNEGTAPAGTSLVHAKALRFEADAKAAGWSALARNGSEDGVSLVTARRGDEELKILWVGGVFQYDRSGYKAKDGAKEIRVRNASAARKLLAS